MFFWFVKHSRANLWNWSAKIPNLLNLLILTSSRLNSASTECLRSGFRQKTREKSTLELHDHDFWIFDEKPSFWRLIRLIQLQSNCNPLIFCLLPFYFCLDWEIRLISNQFSVLSRFCFLEIISHFDFQFLCQIEVKFDDFWFRGIVLKFSFNIYHFPQFLPSIHCPIWSNSKRSS